MSTRSRTRECVDETGLGEDDLDDIDLQCIGGDTNGTDTESCLTGICEGHWGSWEAWSTCSVSDCLCVVDCHRGLHSRRRDCVTPPGASPGWTSCPSGVVQAFDVQVCNPNTCQWGAEWAMWSECDAECNGGLRKRTRDCTGSEDLTCIGIETEADACNVEPCNSPCGNINTAPFYAALDVGVRSTIECKSNNFCTLLCIDQTKVPVIEVTGTDTQWDGRIDCVDTTWTITSQLYTCQDLPCQDIVDIGDLDIWSPPDVSLACSGGACAVVCSWDEYMNPYPATVDCGNINRTDSASCSQLTCGNINDIMHYTIAIAMMATMNITYHSLANYGELICHDSQLVPYPFSIFTCDMKYTITEPAICAPTYCGDTSQFTNVPDNSSFICDENTQVCNVLCDHNVYGTNVKPYPANVTCNIDTRQFNEALNTTFECQTIESQCGDIWQSSWLSSYQVDYLRSKFNYACDATNCDFTCMDVEKVPYYINFISSGVFVTQWDGQVACIQPTNNTYEWDSTEVQNTGCNYLPCPHSFHWKPSDVDTSSDASLACSGGSCAVVCSNNQYPSPVTEVNCSNSDTVSYVYCTELSCGFMTDVLDWTIILYMRQTMDMSCDSIADRCDMTCDDANLVPYPYSTITCDMTHSLPASCAATGCGDPDEWNYGAGFYDVTASNCNGTAGTCDLTCVDTPGRTFPYPVMQVQCTNHVLTPSAGSNIVCAETPCGNVNQDFSFNAADVNVTCDGFVSVNQSNATSCSAECIDPTKVLIGDSTLTCLNYAFTNTDKALTCKDTTCGDLSDKWTVAADVSYTCDGNGLCTFTCDDNSQVPNAASVQCTNSAFADLVLFNGQLTNPNIICEAAADTYCGDTSQFTNVAANTSFVCDANTQVCSVVCDPNVYGTEVQSSPTNITCNVDTRQFNEALNTAITCDETKCGNPDAWNFGVDYASMTKTCDMKNNGNMDCILTCSVGTDTGFVLDVDGNAFSTIVCQSDRTLLPAEGAVSLSCAETPCGKLSTNTNIDPAVTATCDSTGCTFDCSVTGTMSSYSALACDNNGYNHVDGSDINPIQCVATQDTPCGDISTTFTYDPAEVNLKCAAFNSIHQNGAVTCAPTCTNPTKSVITDTTLTCENQAFTNTNLNILCKSTTCGDVADKFIVGSGVSHTCDATTGICSFTCDIAGELPLVNQVTCNAQTNVFDDVTLWPNSINPVLNPTIICEVRDEVPCGNAADFPNVGNDTVITCDYASLTCSLSCDGSVPTGFIPNIDVIDCNPITRQFSHTLDFEFNCKLYDVTCGNIEDSFTLLPGVIPSWSYFEAENQSLDICTLSCNDTTLVPLPITEIVCDHDTEQFLTTVQQTIECVPPPETICGYISDSYIVDASAGAAQCDGNTCWFTCASPTDYAAIAIVTCTGSGYFPAGGTISCISGFDTACGNIDVNSNSAKNCTNNVCNYSCSPGQFLHGVTQATCTIINGITTIITVANLHSDEHASTVSICGDTMCGDLDDLGVTIDTDVVINSSLIGPDGYGSIQLDCPTTDLVISGLRGQSAVACLPNGQFDVIDVTATIRCSETTCGDVADNLIVDPAIVTTCSGDACTFRCDIDDADAVEPTLSQVICQTSTGKFLTGNHKSIRCIVGCDEFGPETGFILDDFVEQKCNNVAVSYLEDERYCDLICRKKGRTGKSLLPTVQETGQSISKLFCHNAGSNDGVWKSVVYNQYGVPIVTPIKANPTFGAVRHVVCDEDLEIDQGVEEECVDVRESFDINEEHMVMRCTPEACTFICKSGLRLMDGNPSVVTCKIRHSDQWVPIYHSEIKCIEEAFTIDDGGSGCGSLSVDKQSIVNQKCSGNTCTFSCTDGGSPSVSHINCENGKWRIPKDAKKKGIKCDGGNSNRDTGCGTFTAFESGVVPNCNEKVCKFSCEEKGMTPSVKKAKCSNKKGKSKWDLGNKGPMTVSCTAGDNGSSGCGAPSFDDTVSATCDAKFCTFTCVDGDLTPNSISATCGKKNKWSYDDKKTSSVTCSSTDDSGSDAGQPHKCDMNAFAGVELNQCSDAKISTCTVSCVDERTPDATAVSCKKGKWNIDVITCA